MIDDDEHKAIGLYHEILESELGFDADTDDEDDLDLLEFEQVLSRSRLFKPLKCENEIYYQRDETKIPLFVYILKECYNNKGEIKDEHITLAKRLHLANRDDYYKFITKYIPDNRTLIGTLSNTNL